MVQTLLIGPMTTIGRGGLTPCPKRVPAVDTWETSHIDWMHYKGASQPPLTPYRNPTAVWYTDAAGGEILRSVTPRSSHTASAVGSRITGMRSTIACRREAGHI